MAGLERMFYLVDCDICNSLVRAGL